MASIAMVQWPKWAKTTASSLFYERMLFVEHAPELVAFLSRASNGKVFHCCWTRSSKLLPASMQYVCLLKSAFRVHTVAELMIKKFVKHTCAYSISRFVFRNLFDFPDGFCASFRIFGPQAPGFACPYTGSVWDTLYAQVIYLLLVENS